MMIVVMYKKIQNQKKIITLIMSHQKREEENPKEKASETFNFSKGFGRGPDVYIINFVLRDIDCV